jgi:hypothetical protein
MLNLNIKELELLLKGLESLSGNVENWTLQNKVMEEMKEVHNEIELEEHDKALCYFNY